MTPVTQIPRLVTIFGGSGFVGRHLVQALARRGYRIRVAVRNPHVAQHLQPLGNVGQIHAIQANLRHRGSIERAVQGADCVVNLVGILHESGKQRFDAIQAEGARAVAEAARAAGARLVHLSAIGADPESESVYARSKAAGEAAALETVADAVIFRSSIVFGPEDDFFNRFANMARFSPFLPLIGGGHTKFQPVYVSDVAEALARAIDGKVEGGRVYELGGPRIVSFRECMEQVLEVIERKRLLLPLPWALANLMGQVFQILPKPLLTVDQVSQLKVDNIVSEAAEKDGRTLQGLGIRPQGMEAILPTYLWTYRATGQFPRQTSELG
ncbi:MAG: complex I NDUFA9 subunit family protein [Rhizobiaceae bacterium]